MLMQARRDHGCTGRAAEDACALVAPLYALRQPLLALNASDALAAAVSSARSTGGGMGAPALAQLLTALTDPDAAAWDTKDHSAVLALIQLLQDGFTRCRHAMLCVQV